MKINISKPEVLDRAKEANNISSDADLARLLGVSPATVSNWRARESLDYDLVFSKCEHVSFDWLLRGKGEMLNNNSEQDIVGITRYQSATNTVEQSIPIYDLPMSVVLSDFLNQPKEAKDHLALPGLPKCDGAIRAWGNMMAPEIKAGDLIVYKRVKDLRDGIWFGQIYLLSVDREGEEYIMVQYVEESEQEQYVRLVSGNPGKFRPQEVRLDSIKAAAMVKASIRYRAI